MPGMCADIIVNDLAVASLVQVVYWCRRKPVLRDKFRLQRTHSRRDLAKREASCNR